METESIKHTGINPETVNFVHKIEASKQPERIDLQEVKVEQNPAEQTEAASIEQAKGPSPDKLTLEDFYNLDDESEEWIDDVVGKVAQKDQFTPEVSEKYLTSDLKFAIAYLSKQKPGRTVKEWLDSGSELRNTIAEVIPLVPPPEKDISPADGEVAALRDSIENLKKDIQESADKQNIKLKQSGVGKVLKLFGGGNSGQDKIRENLNADLEFLDSLSQSGLLSKELLDKKITVRNPNNKDDFVNGSLKFALQYNGTGHIMNNYLEKFNNTNVVSNKDISEKIVKIFEAISTGSGYKKFTLEDSQMQMTQGMATSPGGRNVSYPLIPGTVKSFKLRGK